jgi:tRNA(Ile)-lysidine synthase
MVVLLPIKKVELTVHRICFAMQESLPSIIIFSIVLEKLVSILVEKCQLDPGKPVLAGVSGGPDSLCMLYTLRQLGYPVIVAHLDHCMRPESGQEALKLHQLAESWGLGFLLGQDDVPNYAASLGLSLEEAARERRYRFLFAQAAQHQVQAVAVGHTADDQVETVLMHLLRGSGLTGLRGMSFRSLPNPWSDSIPLIRPLLGVWREEILTYAEQHNLQPSQDESNLDTRFYRNRLRHELIPELEQINPGVKRRLWQMADILSEDDDILAGVEQAAWKSCFLKQGSGYAAMDAAILRKQPLGIRRRLVRRAIGQLRPGLRDIDYLTVERAVHFLGTSTRSGKCDLAAGLRFELEGERLWLAAWEIDLPGADFPYITAGEHLFLDATWRTPPDGRLASGCRSLTH